MVTLNWSSTIPSFSDGKDVGVVSDCVATIVVVSVTVGVSFAVEESGEEFVVRSDVVDSVSDVRSVDVALSVVESVEVIKSVCVVVEGSVVVVETSIGSVLLDDSLLLLVTTIGTVMMVTTTPTTSKPSSILAHNSRPLSHLTKPMVELKNQCKTGLFLFT